MIRPVVLSKTFAPLMALVLLAAACGSSEDTATAEDAVATDEAVVVDEADDAAFCGASAEQDAREDAFVNPTDPALVEEYVRTSGKALLDAIDIAPAEIADDMQVLADGYEQFFQILKGYDFDIFAASAELEALDESPEQTAADDAVDAWRAEHCDMPEPTDDASADDTGADEETDSFEDVLSSPEGLAAMLESEAGRSMFIEGMTQDGDMTVEQATCLIDNLDAEALSAMTGASEPTADLMVSVLEMMSTCGLAP